MKTYSSWGAVVGPGDRSRLALALLLTGLTGCTAPQATAPAAGASKPVATVAQPSETLRGITVSTPTWGWEWGTPEMDGTLDVLVETGANWVAIHPYAQIHGDGRVTWRALDPNNPPAHIARPIAEAHKRGMKILVKPHLAYWGTRFSWRGDIRFDGDPAAEKRFFQTYGDWITQMAAVSAQADAFAVGTELDQLADREQAWRGIIGRVRAVHPGTLTYAANWDGYHTIGFWDDLDAIGVQAYFPLVKPDEPTSRATLRAGWKRICKDLRRVSERTSRPVIFTELGYDASKRAAIEPWKSGRGGAEEQRLALQVALEVVEQEPVIQGAFLWKWFPGELQRGDFRMSRPDVRAVVKDAWRGAPGPE